MDNTFRFLENVGVTTLSCTPYTAANFVVYKCNNTCLNKANPYLKYKCKKGSTGQINNAQAMATAIYNKGPVVAVFNVPKDFMYYTSGIYIPTTTVILGVHSVKVIGWGYDWFHNINYWIV